jgi:hypothetical protein
MRNAACRCAVPALAQLLVVALAIASKVSRTFGFSSASIAASDSGCSKSS